MSKQIYIDSNGNEIQVSGTVNTADMMPMSGNDSTKVATAIGDLSTLTTTDKSSLVGAVNSSMVKSVLLTGTLNCAYADASTIGYRTTNADIIDITTMTDYPTGKHILGYSIEYANVGTNAYLAIVSITSGKISGNSKISGSISFGIRVYYTES